MGENSGQSVAVGIEETWDPPPGERRVDLISNRAFSVGMESPRAREQRVRPLRAEGHLLSKGIPVERRDGGPIRLDLPEWTAS